MASLTAIVHFNIKTQNSRELGSYDCKQPTVDRLQYKCYHTLTIIAGVNGKIIATVNQMFGGSFQLPTAAERAVIKSLSTVQRRNSERQ